MLHLDLMKFDEQFDPLVVLPCNLKHIAVIYTYN